MDGWSVYLEVPSLYFVGCSILELSRAREYYISVSRIVAWLLKRMERHPGSISLFPVKLDVVEDTELDTEEPLVGVPMVLRRGCR
jgi:hypothetical protein